MTSLYKIIFLLMLSIVHWNCLNPFAPKLEKEPAGDLCTDLSDINNVLCTFRNAYTFKDTILYSSIIAPEFNFIYRDYERGVDISWGRFDEMKTTHALFQTAQSLTLTWNNELSSVETESTYSSIRGFNLVITFNPSDIVYIDGYANLTLKRQYPSAEWKIIRWRDESNF